MNVSDIQAALAGKGYLPGAIDGIMGRQTISALRSFQSDNALAVDGIPGPNTLARLFGAAAPSTTDLASPTLVWFQEARRLLGTKEDPGRGSNDTILQWADDRGIPYKNDDIPWCGLFVSHCISATLDREPLPGGVLRARAWGRFGIPTVPTAGAVMVFWRVSRDSGKGHVGFYAGEDENAYRILGGNQSNSVSLAWVGKNRFVDARWPSTVAPPLAVATMIASRTEDLSTNEA